MLYTGGTTGMPKGVMWRQDDLFRNLAGSLNARFREDPVDYDLVDGGVGGPGFVGLPACPLMHGTGCFTQLILLGRRRLDRAAREPQARRRGDPRHDRAREASTSS